MSLCSPVAGPVPRWERGGAAGRGGAAPVHLAGGRVQALAGRGGGGRPGAQGSLGQGRGVRGCFTRARKEILRLKVWREEEKSVSWEREIPGRSSR